LGLSQGGASGFVPVQRFKLATDFQAMSRFHIQSLDLNLLSVLVTVWETRSVSRAAERMSLTQSAISHALRRLRARVGDALFVPGRDGLVPTPRAAEIIGPVQAALHQIAAALRVRSSFDPASAEVEFRVGTNDLVESWLVSRILRLAYAEAPGAVIHSVPSPDAQSTEALLEGGDLDLAITRRPLAGVSIHCESLAEVGFVTMIRKTEAPATHEMPLELYVERSHVVFRQGPGTNRVDAALSQLGLRRRVGASVQTYYAMLATATQTGYLCTVPAPMAASFAHALDLSVHALPFRVEPAPLYLVWHERYSADPALSWLSECVKRAAANCDDP
jgi:DNA-binding transcriptional LysR family regulator